MHESPDLFCTYDTSESTLNCQLDTFSPTSIAELLNVVRTIESKSCILDPLPAVLLKEHCDMLLPTPYDCKVVSGIWPPAFFSENCRRITITQETFP